MFAAGITWTLSRLRIVEEMPDSLNPYQSPRAVELPPPVEIFNRHSTLLIAASVSVGGLITAVAIYSIFANDPRMGTGHAPSLSFTVAGATALSSAIWGLSGWLQRRGLRGLVITFIAAGVTALMWRVLFGTYADVLGAAACVGWPCGGLVASVFVYLSARYRQLTKTA